MRTAERSIAEPLLASFLVSLVSLVACVAVDFKPPLLPRFCIRDTARDDDVGEKTTTRSKSNLRARWPCLVRALLLADACTHGVPNSFGKEKHKEFAGSCFLVGVLTFYVLDCFIRSRVRKSLASEDDDSATTQKRTTRRTKGGGREKNR